MEKLEAVVPSPNSSSLIKDLIAEETARLCAEEISEKQITETLESIMKLCKM